jgi:hypothetical protein
MLFLWFRPIRDRRRRMKTDPHFKIRDIEVKRTIRRAFATLILMVGSLVVATHAVAAERALPPLRISETKRFLVTSDGKPFFWLADTAWRLSDLTPDEVDAYMANRVGHAFNVIQVHPGFEHPDFAGNGLFLDGDPDRPNEAFRRHIDDIFDKARKHGLYVALVKACDEFPE